MIARLSGKLIDKTNNTAVIDVGGVGYEVTLSSQASAEVEVNKTCSLYIAENIKEDHYQLFGFIDPVQRNQYYQLNSVSGVGPKAAIAILSAHAPEEIQQAIIAGNISLFSNVSGIGRKTASRIVLELKGKLELSEQKDMTDEPAYQALISLGYSAKQAAGAIKETSDDMSVDDKVKHALKALSK